MDDEFNETHPDLRVKPTKAPHADWPSAHRAFIYALICPGYGEYYAGSKKRAAFTLSLFLACLGLFFWEFKLLVDVVFTDITTLASGNILKLIGVASYGMLFFWLWALMSSVDVAVNTRRELGLKPQESVAWPVVMSWICPGAGQVYTKTSRVFGIYLCVFYFAALVYMIPTYAMLAKSSAALFKNTNVLVNPAEVMSLLEQLMLRLELSYASTLQNMAKILAIVYTVLQTRETWFAYYVQDWPLLHQNRTQNPPKTPRVRLPIGRRTEGRVLLLVALGYFCPGTGQLILHKDTLGWALLGAYAGLSALIAILFTQEIITAATVNTLTWIAIIIRISAILESAISCVKGHGALQEAD